MRLRQGSAAAALLATAVAGAVWWTSGSSPRTAAVERRDLVLGVGVTGVLRSEDPLALGPPQVREIWNYKISFLAPEGSTVEAGQPVLGFDTTELQTRLLEARAEVESAAQTFEQRRQDLEIARRRERLTLAEAEAKSRRLALQVDVPAEIEAANELRRARLDYERVKAEIASRRHLLELLDRGAKAELQSLAEARDHAVERLRRTEAQIAAMTVAAPRAGTVVYVSDWQGQKKKVGDSCWRMEKVVELPDLGRMLGEAEAPEAESGRLAVGQPVSLRLDAFPDRSLSGVVRKVERTIQRRSPEDPRKVARFAVELDDGGDGVLRPGMRFTGEVEIGRLSAALAVPLEAVVPTAAGPQVEVEGWLHRRRVSPRLGRANGRWVEVLSGLEEGQRVILP